MKDKEVKEAMQSDHSMDLPKRDKGKKVWMIIAIIALVALIGMGVYGYMQMQKTNQKIKDQQAQIDDLNNKKKTLEDAVAAAAKAATDAATKAVTNTVTGQTDKDMIAAALKSRCALHAPENPDIQSFTIKTISGNYAQGAILCKGANEGPEVVLVKANNNWNIVAVGLGEDIVPAKVRELYKIPADIGKP